MATPRTLATALVSLFTATMLIGCAPEPAPEPTPEPVVVEPAPQPTVEETEEPDAADDTLFTVSATVRAIDGTSMSIALVGHSALAARDEAAADLVDDFVKHCEAMNGRSVSDVMTPISAESLEKYGSSLLLLEYSSTPDGHTFLAPVDLALGSPYYAEVAFGDALIALAPNDTCTGGYQLTGAGSGSAIANYESGSERADLGQWRYGHYGFSVPFESGATIEACRVVVSELAAQAVADVPGWEPGSDTTGISCGIGYRGE